VSAERSWRRLEFGDRFTGWTGPIAISLLALFLRLWKLDRPQAFSFDETYYAKDAYSLLRFGYVRDYVEKADRLFLNDRATDAVFEDTPAFIAHPDLGKWMIAVGEYAFGMNPFGWRVSAAVVGALMVLVMCRLVRRLTGSTLLGCVAGLLLSLDGLHLVLSRLALLDIFAAFFLLCGVAAIAADRDWFRARLARRLVSGDSTNIFWRPWLIVSGVCFGCTLGVKWTAVYSLAVFGILIWVWSVGARRAAGQTRIWLKSAIVDGVPAFCQVVLVAAVVYLSTWTGWLIHADKYEETHSSSQYRRYVDWPGQCDGDKMVDVKYDDSRQWPTATEPDATGLGEVTQSLRSLWYYHQDLYVFHAYFLNCAEHTYASKPSGWLLLSRPVGVDAQLDIQPGDQGCQAEKGSTCLRQVLLLGNPVIWWGGCVALLVGLAMWLGGRDWRFGFALLGVVATWLPWLLYDDRPIFLFYAIATLPFMVIALTLTLGYLIGGLHGPRGRPLGGVVIAGTYVLAAMLAFAWFWPIWTDELLTNAEWTMRMWFNRWI
jgi:dolichyl-phosphate-mannose-protein mannosyltransferase